MAVKPLTYTQQVAKFDADSSTRHAEEMDTLAKIMAAVQALKPSEPGPTDPGPTDPGPTDPGPTDPPPPPPPVGEVVDLGGYRRGRMVAQPKVLYGPQQLAEQRLMFPFDRSQAMRAGDPELFVYELGDFTNLDSDPEEEDPAWMPMTGERGVIGLVTEDTAEFLMGGSPNNMLVMAETSGSVPLHAMEEGRVVDYFKYPRASFDPRQAPSPYYDISSVARIPDRGDVPVIDTAHYPALSYVAYCATRDPYYLEELQFTAAMHIMITPIEWAKPDGAIWPNQVRQVAWALRDLFGAYFATQLAEESGTLTAKCLPSSHWKRLLDTQLYRLTAMFKANYDGTPWPADVQSLIDQMGFLACTDYNGWLGPWQQDYLGMVLGWAVWTGRVPEWRSLYETHVRQAIGRASGPMRSQAIQYYLPAPAPTWEEALAKAGYKPTPDGDFPWEAINAAPDYVGYLSGVLRVAVMNGVKDPRLPEADAYVNGQVKRLNYRTKRWSVAR